MISIELTYLRDIFCFGKEYKIRSEELIGIGSKEKKVPRSYKFKVINI